MIAVHVSGWIGREGGAVNVNRVYRSSGLTEIFSGNSADSLSNSRSSCDASGVPRYWSIMREASSTATNSPSLMIMDGNIHVLSS